MTLGDIIKNYRRTHNDMSMDAFSIKSGISKSYISLLEKNEHPKTGKPIIPSIKYVKQAADGMSMDFNVLFSMIDGDISLNPDDELNLPVKKGGVINVLGRVAAGIPLEAIEDVVDTEEIPADLARTGNFFGLKISGDSMEPEIRKGDTVIVRQQDDADSGDIVIAMANGSDATCKKLVKYKEGINLISINSNYEPMFFSNREIDEKPVRIIGKVIESRRKF